MIDKPARAKSSSFIFWLAAVLLFLALGLGLLWLSFQPFLIWQALGNRLSPDGSLEMLTEGMRAALLLPLRVLGGLALIAAAGLLAWRERGIRLLRQVVTFPVWFGVTLWRDLPRFFTWKQPDRLETLAVVALMAAALVARMPLLDRPVIHDEAYTVETWATGSLRYALEDYHLPNNHIFHTLQVQAVVKTLGTQPWMVRLPAFIAALLLVPAGYGLARRWYGPRAAFLAAGLIAAAPVLVDYATNARGYTWYMLFTLLVFLLASGLLQRNNLAGWCALILCAGLGFWTVPMMLYPFGGVCAWIALSALLDAQAARAYGGSPWRLMRYLVAAGISAGLLALLLYAPVLLKNGPGVLFSNQFVTSLPWDVFRETMLASRIPETLREMLSSWGWAGGLFVGLGVLLSFIFQRRISAFRVHPLAALALFVVPVMLLQRPNAWPRVSSYLYALLFIFAAAGWMALADRLTPLRPRWQVTGAAALIAAALIFTGARSFQACPALVCPPGEEELAVQTLQPLLTGTDLVLVASPSDAPIWYYFRQYGLSHEHFQKNMRFYRAFLLLSGDQTADFLIDYRGPEPFFFRMDTQRTLANFGILRIDEIQADAQKIDSAFSTP